MPSTIDKKSITSHSNEERWSGSIKVKMTVITPLIAVKEMKHTMQKDYGETIPGSSIRGALRSAAEILWGGTVSVFKKGKYLKEEWKMSNSTIHNHCPVSHLFGFVASEKDKPKTEEFEQQVPWALGSKLKFSKATAILQTFQGSAIQMEQLYSPRKQPPLSVAEDGRKYFLGRKVYLAGRMEGVYKKMKAAVFPKKEQSFNPKDYFSTDARLNKPNPEYAIFPGTQYIFFIEFSQLTKDELTDVIRLLELKEGYYHALGKGKPLGLGRVRFEVEGILRKDKDYYLQWDATDLYDVSWKEQLLQETQNLYEENFIRYYELIDIKKFDNKKSYGSGNQKVYRYSELNNRSKQKNVQNQPKKSSTNHNTSKRKIQSPSGDKGLKSKQGMREK